MFVLSSNRRSGALSIPRAAMLAPAFLLALCGGAFAQQGGQRPATAIEAQRVAVETIAEAVHSIGSVQADKSIIVRPEIAGVVTSIHFRESTPVRKGDRLFSLDDAIYRAELQQAQARLNLSQRNHDRAIELFQGGAGTARARDEARSNLETAQAELAVVQARLEKTVISAPFDGIVGLTSVDPGEYVQVGQDLVTLTDVDPVLVDFNVPERYLRFLSPGQLVRVVADALPGRAFDGAVYAISPIVDPAGRSLAVRARAPNPEGALKPGMFVRIDVEITQQAKAIMVPEQAIVPRGDKQFVFVVVDDVAREAEVEVGLRSFGRVEIIKGLSAGDLVVTAGQLKIRDGTNVRVLQPDGTAAQAESGR
jgi:membrane fusion protein (multidrug efflux system)